MMHDFLEEMCVAGGTVLFFCFCTSPDVASLKGGRVMCEGKFWHVRTKDVLHVLFQTNLKPNDSDVKHCSLVKHSCFIFAKHWRTRNTVFDVRDSCCQRTALM